MEKSNDKRGEQVSGAAHRKVQIRKAREGTWTKAKRNAFLDHLAETANVKHSAQMVGLGAGSAHGLRRRDATFAAAWADALDQGYAHIEAQLLARAIGQDADPERSETAGAIPADPHIALRLLALRRDGYRPRATVRLKQAPIEQARAYLSKNLGAMAERLKVEL